MRIQLDARCSATAGSGCPSLGYPVPRSHTHSRLRSLPTDVFSANFPSMNHTLTDSHVHFWDPRALRYPWLDAYPSLRRRYGPGEYAAAIADAPVSAILLVEGNCVPAQSLAEVRSFEGI